MCLLGVEIVRRDTDCTLGKKAKWIWENNTKVQMFVPLVDDSSNNVQPDTQEEPEMSAIHNVLKGGGLGKAFHG